MADGGLVSRIKGVFTTATTDRKPDEVPLGSGAAAQAKNALTTRRQVLDEAERKAVGMAKGGHIRGKGTGTSDQIPIMASNGEFMIKAAAVKKIGVPALEALNAIADGGKKPPSRKVPRGAVRKMAAGGIIEDDPMRRVAPYVNHRPPNGPPAMPPPLALPNNAPPPANAVTLRHNFTMGGTPPVTPQATTVPPYTDVRPKYDWSKATKEAKAYMADRAANPGPQPAGTAVSGPARQSAVRSAVQSAAGRLSSAAASPGARGALRSAPYGAAVAALPEVLDTAVVAQNPNASPVDVATQASQGVGRMASTGLGAAGGAALGAMTGPLAPVAVPLGAIAGGAYGYWAGNKAIEAGRSALGVDPRAPVDQLKPVAKTAQPVVVPSQSSVGAVRRGAGFDDPRRVDLDPSRASLGPSRDFTRELASVPAQLPSDLRDGVVYKTRGANGETVYSGRDIGGSNVQMVNGLGADVGRLGSGNSISANAGGGALRYGGPRGSDAALSAARSAAAARGDVDALKASYAAQGESFGAQDDPVQMLINNGRPMTTRKAAAIAQLQQAQSQARGAVADRKLAQDKFDLERDGAKLDNQTKQRLAGLQDVILNDKATPAQRKSAIETYRALTGKAETQNRYTVVPGGQAIDPATNQAFTQPSRVIDNQTGLFVEQQAQSGRGTNQAPQDGTKVRGKDGKLYVVQNGVPVPL